jgi:hypothetical protein
MDCLLGKILMCRAQNKGSLRDILGLNGVAYVNQPGLGVNVQNDPLHRRDIGIRESEIGGQRYYGSHFA